MWCQQLLQSPPSRKPYTSSELLDIIRVADVVQICEAHFRVRVPTKHGIHRLGHFSIAILIHATGVDPQPIHMADVLFDILSEAFYLFVTAFIPVDFALHILQRCFVVDFPPMRCDCVFGYITIEFTKLESVDVEQPHERVRRPVGA